MPNNYGGQLGDVASSQARIGGWDDRDDDDIDERMLVDEEELMNMQRQSQGIIDAQQDQVEEYMDEDDDSSTASIPDEDINFSLTYALHTFVATVEGQASVVKGDSLVLLDDANSYWWLVRVLKTEDVGYIPAENIETPFERLARLNKHRNVDLASATPEEAAKANDVDASRQTIQKIATRQANASISRSGSLPIGSTWNEESPLIGGGSDGDERERKVVFAAPTYVDHPGVTWSETSEDETDEDGARVVEETNEKGREEGEDGGSGMEDMEPDDGVAWDESAGAREQRRLQGERIVRQQQQPQQQQLQQQHRHQQQQQQQEMTISEHPTTRQQQAERSLEVQQQDVGTGTGALRASNSREYLLDPAELQDAEPRRITVTPPVARGGSGPQDYRAPSAQTHDHSQRSTSAASANSTFSTVSLGTTASGHSTITPDDVEDGGDKRSKRPARLEKSEKKLRKSSTDESSTEEGTKKRKSAGGVFSGLFKKKEKKDKGVRGGLGSEGGPSRPMNLANDSDSFVGRSSDDSMQIGPHDSPGAVGITPRSAQTPLRPVVHPAAASPSGVAMSNGSSPSSNISPHGLRLQQIDQQQQRLYQQYMARSPSSDAIEPASRSFGTQAAATVAQSSAAARLAIATQTGGRPGSIILSSNPNSAGPLLNVMRVFAGEHVDSDSSFKTVLLSESTTARDLVKQACQRFRIVSPSGNASDIDDYFLTIKEVDGEELSLEADNKPLEAFNEMCKRIGEEDAAYRANTVKRSSVGSISSISSNLSLNPAIARLGMNDFSDDSNVKLFLNRRLQGSVLSSTFHSYGSYLAAVPEDLEGHHAGGVPAIEVAAALEDIESHTDKSDRVVNKTHQTLSVSTTGTASPERTHSPSARFTIQVVVYPDELPEGMVFDTMSEAIVPKSVLRERAERASSQGGVGSPGVSATERKKLLVLPRNTTVAEAIEAVLERYGIAEGVVDGGDDVEDKVGNRRHAQKVRYGLGAREPTDGTERMLLASHKLLEAYRVPPKTKVIEKLTGEIRRRSRDFSQSSSMTDLQASDPVFVLRRMGGAPPVSLTTPSTHIPLDDVALQRRRLSDSSAVRQSSPTSPVEPIGRSRQEIIAAQRAASRANQMAILSAQTNNSQGVDVVLADQSTIRSSRLLTEGGEQVRYSYISQDGETYDISQLIEDEWGEEEETEDRQEVLSQPTMNRQTTDISVYCTAPSTPLDAPRDTPPLDRAASRMSSSSANDLLAGVFQRTRGETDSKIVAKLDRVLSKVKAGEVTALTTGHVDDDRSTTLRAMSPQDSARPGSSQDRYTASRPSVYVNSPREVSLSPVLEDIPINIKRAVEEAPSRSSSRQMGSPSYESNLRMNSRQPGPSSRISSRHRQQPSIASVISDYSVPDTETGLTTPLTGQMSAKPTPPTAPLAFSLDLNSASPTPRNAVKYKDDFGITRMLGVIQARAIQKRPPPTERPELDDIQKLFFGERIDLTKVHPEARKIYEPLHSRLDAADIEIDEMLIELMGIKQTG